MIDQKNSAPGTLDVFTATLAEIRRAGLAAVARALGPVGLARFLQVYEGGQGDYTADRDAIVGTPTVDEVMDAMGAVEPERPTA